MLLRNTLVETAQSNYLLASLKNGKDFDILFMPNDTGCFAEIAQFLQANIIHSGNVGAFSDM